MEILIYLGLCWGASAIVWFILIAHELVKEQNGILPPKREEGETQ